MTIMSAGRARELAEKTLAERHDGILKTAIQKINEASGNGKFSVAVYYGKEMNNDSREWLTNKLRENGYKTTSQYSNQYNEMSFSFNISW